MRAYTASVCLMPHVAAASRVIKRRARASITTGFVALPTAGARPGCPVVAQPGNICSTRGV